MGRLLNKSEIEFEVEFEGSYCTTESVNVLVVKEGVLINGEMIKWEWLDKARQSIDKKHHKLTNN